MPFTFECGVCHAVYRLEENQITPMGVKITCPRCLNFFFLKRGGTQEADVPVVEHVVSDGVYDVSKKPIAEQPTVMNVPIKPATPIREESFQEKVDRISPTQAGLTLASNTHVTDVSELIELPPDPPKPTLFDHLFWPLSFLVLGTVVALALNMKGVIHIPGLPESFSPAPIVTPIPEPTPNQPATEQSKHAFPQVDSAYDPWTGAPKETVTPSEQK